MVPEKGKVPYIFLFPFVSSLLCNQVNNEDVRSKEGFWSFDNSMLLKVSLHHQNIVVSVLWLNMKIFSVPLVVSAKKQNANGISRKKTKNFCFLVAIFDYSLSLIFFFLVFPKAENNVLNWSNLLN